jgi:hypothetical protein
MTNSLDIEPKDVLAQGNFKQSVKAPGLLCYRGTKEKGKLKKIVFAPLKSDIILKSQKVAVMYKGIFPLYLH